MSRRHQSPRPAFKRSPSQEALLDRLSRTRDDAHERFLQTRDFAQERLAKAAEAAQEGLALASDNAREALAQAAKVQEAAVQALAEPQESLAKAAEVAQEHLAQAKLTAQECLDQAQDSITYATTQPAIRRLSQEGLEHIKGHKYVPGKYTPLDNLLNPWWLFLTNLLPMSLAPNLVTFMGLIPLALVYGLLWSWSPSGTEPAPPWLLYTGAGALFLYQTLDAMDGKQARRTGSSTPLGQLFDHGCDCLGTMSHHCQAMAVLMPGGTPLALAGLTALQTMFYLAQWEEYHTGILQTAAGPIGVTETQYSLMLMLLLGGFAGSERLSGVMHAPVPDWVPIFGGGWKVNEAYICGWIAFCLSLICACMVRMYWAKKGEVLTTLKEVIPVGMLVIFCLFWERTALKELGRAVFFITGLQFFYLTTQLIVVSMARQPFPALQRSLIPYACLVAASQVVELEYFKTVAVLYAVGFSLYSFLWVLYAIRDIKGKLKIRVFRIKKPDDTKSK